MKYKFIEAAAARDPSFHTLQEIQFHQKYSEPGYSDPESGIICTGNWNVKSYDKEYDRKEDLMNRVAHILEERYGAELEWSDEWANCSECNGLVRTSPDGPGWIQAWVELDGDIICRNCVGDHAEEVLISKEGNPGTALTRDLGLNPEQHGYLRILEGLENGLHEHMAADPKVIAKELQQLGVKRFLFVIDDTSQFYITFSCWVHEEEVKKVENIDIKTDAAVSPATMMKRAMQDASRATEEMGPSPGEGYVKYMKAQPDGTMKARWVSPEEFVAGIKD